MDPTKKRILTDRFYFLIEVVIVFIGIFLLSLFHRIALPLIIAQDTVLFGILFYLFRALMVFIAIPLFLLISNIVLESRKTEIIVEQDISPAKGHIMMFKITKGNYKYQFIYGFLIFFLIFLPLDFFTYVLFPQMLEYQAAAITSNPTAKYLMEGYTIFFISVIIIQCSVAFYEELVFRGFVTKRGSEHFNKMSAIMIASFYFGLVHFAYIMLPASRNYILFPFIWFLQTFIVAIILGIFIVKKRRIFPVILAHALNNIVSAHAIWNHIQGNSFINVALYMYIPLLLVSLVLLIWQFSRVKNGFSLGLNEIKSYFQLDDSIDETNNDRIIRILIDLLFGFIIFIIGLLLI